MGRCRGRCSPVLSGPQQGERSRFTGDSSSRHRGAGLAAAAAAKLTAAPQPRLQTSSSPGGHGEATVPASPPAERSCFKPRHHQLCAVIYFAGSVGCCWLPGLRFASMAFGKAPVLPVLRGENEPRAWCAGTATTKPRFEHLKSRGVLHPHTALVGRAKRVSLFPLHRSASIPHLQNRY